MNNIFLNKKAIIFDMDGVLLDTEEYHRIAWNKTFAREGVYLEQKDYYRCCQSVGRYKAIKNVIPEADDRLIRELSAIKGQYFTDEINNCSIELYADAVKFLKYVQKEFEMAIGTASSMGREVISRTDYMDYFKVIVTGKDIKKNKPNPEIFLKAAEGLKVSNKDAVVIEDSLVGVIAGILGGMDVVAVNRNDSLKGIKIHCMGEYIRDLGIDLSEKEEEDIKKQRIVMVNSLEEIV